MNKISVQMKMQKRCQEHGNTTCGGITLTLKQYWPIRSLKKAISDRQPAMAHSDTSVPQYSGRKTVHLCVNTQFILVTSIAQNAHSDAKGQKDLDVNTI